MLTTSHRQASREEQAAVPAQRLLLALFGLALFTTACLIFIRNH